ncbi:hypothetical protein DRH14_05230 [Candidatus Shapirobacteria bacterium]|nr:MAG: hypothetical protein DRH14_05230 [Candidatus Shapirobacteria bacterium]
MGGVWEGMPVFSWVLTFGIVKYLMLSVFTATRLFKAYKKESDPIKKTQYRYFAILIGIMCGGATEWAANFGIPLHPALFTIPFFLFVFGYGVVRHHLIDVRVVFTRTSILVAVYALLLGIPFYVGYTTKAWAVSSLLFAVFATVAPFIFRYLQQKADDLIFQKTASIRISYWNYRKSYRHSKIKKAFCIRLVTWCAIRAIRLLVRYICVKG